MSGANVFRGVVDSLDDAQITSMLTGSFASSLHGLTRATRDIDFVIEADLPRLARLVEALTARGYYADLDAATEGLFTVTQFNAIDPVSGWKIDFIFRKNRPFSLEEFARRQTVDLDGVGLSVVSAEDVIVAKLEWAKLSESTRQIDDAVGVLRIQGEDLDRQYIDRWVAELGLEPQWQAALRAAGMG